MDTKGKNAKLNFFLGVELFPVCVNCVYDPATDQNLQVTYKRGKLRIILEPITPTLFRCPKCGSMHIISEGFKDENAGEKNRRRRQRLNVQHLKETYH